MDATLLKALVVLVVAGALCAWAASLVARGRSAGALLQLLGAGGLVVVALAHVCEALRLFPFMHWGSPRSVGHYLDFASAILGLTLFPAGAVVHQRTKRHARGVEPGARHA